MISAAEQFFGRYRTSVSITWNALQSFYEPDTAAHEVRLRALGFDCSLAVFEQLFHEQRQDTELARGHANSRQHVRNTTIS